MNALPDPRTLDLIPEQTVPVTVLTGFLGSGKTSLIRRLLALPQAADTAVIVNEFGEIGLDHLLIESVDENIVVLPGGCLCCQAQGDLARALRSLQDKVALGRIPPFARVIVETSGLAYPTAILQAFVSDPLRLSRYRLTGLVTVIDAVLGLGQIWRHETARAQLALADRLLVTKLDLTDERGRSRLMNELRRLSGVPIEAAATDAQLATQLFDMAPAVHQHLTSVATWHAAAFDSLVLRLSSPVDLHAFQAGIENLAHQRGESLLRLKAMADITGDDRPVSFHAVQHLVAPPRFLEAIPRTAPRVLVAIFMAGAGEDIRRDLRDVMVRAVEGVR
ncbi:CobW family GTP-binding protein [Aestuariivirga sp. YIM B02566]|uniref:GTP-binding protein n=1 Tax=Taklimakanibacter albus TaxID=2800327 RepID=A0ACC5R0Y7_9HYPH|nr:GTP-binding protein [Aestuariivirga sp. YIM B02566]MBK1866093.1 GTP-binding protein [Aestuariivirga sp. YIM B02566]